MDQSTHCADFWPAEHALVFTHSIEVVDVGDTKAQAAVAQACHLPCHIHAGHTLLHHDAGERAALGLQSLWVALLREVLWCQRLQASVLGFVTAARPEAPCSAVALQVPTLAVDTAHSSPELAVDETRKLLAESRLLCDHSDHVSWPRDLQASGNDKWAEDKPGAGSSEGV
jgi:hypothetical protein